jgi:hypothetical protein
MMKKTILLGLAASLTLMGGASALAQPYGPPPPHRYDARPAPGAWGIDQRLDWMQQRLDRGRADGSLDRREARRVQDEINHIRWQVRSVRDRQGGRLYDRQRDEFQARLDRLNDRIRWLRHNDERRPW